ncbi:nucleotidyltransferase [candidate division KSB1 bacterium]|nr:nucleotidyltransferase [candidate division KSB1 bacterium]
MANQFKDFLLVLKALDDHNVDYVLIGGVAVILHGLERLTRDIDLFIKMIPKNIDNFRKALSSVFNDTSIEEITLKELQDYPVIRYGTPNGFYIDIMTRLGEAVSFEDLEYEIIESRGVKIKIATPEILYNLKKDSLRDKDKIDVQFLKEIIIYKKSNQNKKN